jgi:DNA-binding MarR family transcriptional regulator
VSRFFAPVPLDFDQAFKNGDLTSGAYLVGCHLAAESYRSKHTDDGVVTLHVSALAELCEVSPSTIRRALHALERKGWIRFAVRERQQGPWRIRLTGLAKPDEERACVTPASPDPPLVTQAPASPPATEESAIQRPKPDSPPSSLRPSRARIDETRRDQKSLKANPRSEEKLDHVVGETTATGSDPGVTDRLLAKVEDLDRRKRNGRPVSVEQADDASLVWSGEAQEGEAGVLADCQALVDAGLGEWIEDDRDRLLSDEELAELGTLPLDEVHRRRERGEL